MAGRTERQVGRWASRRRTSRCSRDQAPGVGAPEDADGGVCRARRSRSTARRRSAISSWAIWERSGCIGCSLESADPRDAPSCWQSGPVIRSSPMALSRTSSSLELFVPIDRGDARPLHQQLEQQLREAVRSGRMAPDSRLPSTRALAAQLGLARGVVVEAYAQLAAEGYLLTAAGRHDPGGTGAHGADVTGRGAANPRRSSSTSARATRHARSSPGSEWSALAAARAQRSSGGPAWLPRRPRRARAPRSAVGVPRPGSGDVCTRARDIVICNGYAQGLAARRPDALHETGARRVGVEDPWKTRTGACWRASGLEIVPIPVDDGGLQVEHLEQAAR